MILGGGLAVLAGVLVLGSQFGSNESAQQVRWRDLSNQVGPLTLTHSARQLFREPDQFARFLRRLEARSRPTVDFERRQLLLLSPGPRSSSGYSLEILRVTESDGKLTIRLHERTPGLSDRVDPHVTYPYRLLSLPAGQDVFVDWIGR